MVILAAHQWLSPCSTHTQRTVHGPGHTRVRVGLLDRSAGSKTDPIEMTGAIDRALCAVDL
jgi:hypothetical protein